jgi:hypothetical protein
MNSKTCDFCRRKMSTGNYIDYGLHLKNFLIQPDPGVVTDMFVRKLLDQEKYFCRFLCLREWCENNYQPISVD